MSVAAAQEAGVCKGAAGLGAPTFALKADAPTAVLQLKLLAAQPGAFKGWHHQDSTGLQLPEGQGHSRRRAAVGPLERQARSPPPRGDCWRVAYAGPETVDLEF